MIARLIETAIGIWLMAAPAVLAYGSPAEISDRITGPVIGSFSIIAIWEATRGLRRANLPVALWLVIAPFVLSYGETAAIVNSIACGVAIGLLSFAQGRITGRFGGGWRVLLGSDSRGDQR